MTNALLKTPKRNLRSLPSHLFELAYFCSTIDGGLFSIRGCSYPLLEIADYYKVWLYTKGIAGWLSRASQVKVEMDVDKFNNYIDYGYCYDLYDGREHEYSAKHYTAMMRFLLVWNALEETYRYVHKWNNGKPVDENHINNVHKQKQMHKLSCNLKDGHMPVGFKQLSSDLFNHVSELARTEPITNQIEKNMTWNVEKEFGLKGHALMLIMGLRNVIVHGDGEGLDGYLTHIEYESLNEVKLDIINLYDKAARIAALYIQANIKRCIEGFEKRFEKIDYNPPTPAVQNPEQYAYFLKIANTRYLSVLHYENDINFEELENRWHRIDDEDKDEKEDN